MPTFHPHRIPLREVTPGRVTKHCCAHKCPKSNGNGSGNEIAMLTSVGGLIKLNHKPIINGRASRLSMPTLHPHRIGSTQSSKTLLRSQMSEEQREQLRPQDRNAYKYRRDKQTEQQTEDRRSQQQVWCQPLTHNCASIAPTDGLLESCQLLETQQVVHQPNQANDDYCVVGQTLPTQRHLPQPPLQNPTCSEGLTAGLFRSQMSEDQRECLSHRDRNAYKRRRDNQSGQQTDDQRPRQQVRRQPLTDNSEPTAPTHGFLQPCQFPQAHQSQQHPCQPSSNCRLVGHSLASQRCRPHPHLQNPSCSERTTGQMAARLQRHLQAEMQRIGMPSLAASVTTDANSIGINLIQAAFIGAKICRLPHAQMTEAQRNTLRERDRFNYRQRQEKLTAAELNSKRIHARQQEQARRQKLADDERARLRARKRQLCHNHQRPKFRQTR